MPYRNELQRLVARLRQLVQLDCKGCRNGETMEEWLKEQEDIKRMRKELLQRWDNEARAEQ